MASYEIKVPRLRDRDLFRFISQAAVTIGAISITVSEIGGVARTVSLKEEELRADHLSQSDLFTIYSASTALNQHSVSISRSTPDAFSDTLRIETSSNSHQQPEPDVVRNLNALISKTFAGAARPIEQILTPKSVESLITSHQEMLLRLQSSATSITETIAQAHSKLEAEFAARAKQLDEDFQARSKKADDNLESERKKLREREDELAQRNRELDDRDNTTARRAQHATLKSRIAERAKAFEITPETKGARTPIHWGVLAGIAVLLVLILLSTTSLSSLPADASSLVWAVALIKPVGLTIALLGLIAWYLRWMNRWFERHADAEFYLKQFELDIDRANWVVETALEWKEKQDRTIPDALLGSISRNLFLKTDRDEDSDMHPADYLASAILGRASSLDLKVPGGEIHLTGKDMKKLAKDPPIEN
ncbi:hypothetical protein [Brucella intermedia]|uniref:hypothetical protein n=1 Tax=Brucella intermedia TaxID=94625 RepID=UPI0007C74E08|nr:hypothetical protein [Brucella intermedia]OAE39596.1 hypothetical protein A7J42_13870 [Brucella intermedia]